MKTTPPRGMHDYLPEEVALRSHVQQTILQTYQKYGFQRISTPALEAAENLEKSEGGENLSLIYQVLKRGSKLQKALDNGDELWDLGLRYDLTVPMTRYYSANRDKLPSPFKCIQMDRVYRAERPQKGRLREFVQCDIDIIGTESLDAEAELVLVTANALEELGFTNFSVNINSRQLINNLLLHCGFAANDLEAVCIALDKLDKIGLDGVIESLKEKEQPPQVLEKLSHILNRPVIDLPFLAEQLPDDLSIQQLTTLIDTLNALSSPNWQVVFDLSVIRGQGYYTGTVFEVTHPDYPGAIAGGGRYDTLIEKFTGQPVPAVGFSIGFERILSILKEQQLNTSSKPTLALIYIEGEEFADAFKASLPLHSSYDVTLVARTTHPKSLGKTRKRVALSGFGYVMELGKEIQKL